VKPAAPCWLRLPAGAIEICVRNVLQQSIDAENRVRVWRPARQPVWRPALPDACDGRSRAGNNRAALWEFEVRIGQGCDSCHEFGLDFEAKI